MTPVCGCLGWAHRSIIPWKTVVAAGLDPPGMIREDVTGLYNLVVSHRAVFLSAELGSLRGPPAAGARPSRGGHRRDRHTSGYTFDPHIAGRIVFAAVTTTALHQEQALGDRTVNDIVNELCAIRTTGLTRRTRGNSKQTR
jgi:hypothetical protein